MKKVNFKVVLMALSFAFSLLFLGANRLEAQTTGSLLGSPGNSSLYGTGVFSIPQGSFVSNQEAETILLAAMVDLKDQLAPMNPGAPLYISTVKLLMYYGAIYVEVQAGKAVAEAIAIGLSKVAVSQDTTNVPTQSELVSMKNSAIALLSN